MRKRLAAGDPDHLAHQVDAGDHLRHRMLDLDARVHLQEVELVAAIVVQIFERSGAAVVHRLGERDRGRTELLANGWRQRGRGSFLPDLLTAALQRALALEAVDDVVSVAEHLHLDVPRAFDELLDIEPAVAEGRERLGLRLRHEVMKLLGRARDADAAAAAAGRRLDHHGKADLLRQRECRLGATPDGRGCPEPSALPPPPPLPGRRPCRPSGGSTAPSVPRRSAPPPRPRRRTRRSRQEIHSRDGWRRRRLPWPRRESRRG